MWIIILNDKAINLDKMTNLFISGDTLMSMDSHNEYYTIYDESDTDHLISAGDMMLNILYSNQNVINLRDMFENITEK